MRADLFRGVERPMSPVQKASWFRPPGPVEVQSPLLPECDFNKGDHRWHKLTLPSSGGGPS